MKKLLLGVSAVALMTAVGVSVGHANPTLKNIGPGYGPDSTGVSYNRGDIDIGTVDVHVDVDQAQSVAARFGVMSVPTVLLMAGGVVKDQMIGLASKQALADRIDKVL